MGACKTAETPPNGAEPGRQTRRFFTNLTVQPGRAQIATHGDIDLATRDALSEVAVDALGQPSIHEVVLDLGSVNFLDASGLGCLVTIRNASLQLDRKLVLSNVPARIVWLLELTDLLRHFTVETLSATSAAPASARTHEIQLGGHDG